MPAARRASYLCRPARSLPHCTKDCLSALTKTCDPGLKFFHIQLTRRPFPHRNITPILGSKGMQKDPIGSAEREPLTDQQEIKMRKLLTMSLVALSLAGTLATASAQTYSRSPDAKQQEFEPAVHAVERDRPGLSGRVTAPYQSASQHKGRAGWPAFLSWSTQTNPLH